jgi:hypothetical protein
MMMDINQCVLSSNRRNKSAKRDAKASNYEANSASINPRILKRTRKAVAVGNNPNEILQSVEPRTVPQKTLMMRLISNIALGAGFGEGNSPSTLNQ